MSGFNRRQFLKALGLTAAAGPAVLGAEQIKPEPHQKPEKLPEKTPELKAVVEGLSIKQVIVKIDQEQIPLIGLCLDLGRHEEFRPLLLENVPHIFSDNTPLSMKMSCKFDPKNRKWFDGASHDIEIRTEVQHGRYSHQRFRATCIVAAAAVIASAGGMINETKWAITSEVVFSDS